MYKGNQYYEEWTKEKATDFLKDAIKISENKDFDFIGEVAKEQGSFKEVYSYLTKKFPDLKPMFKQVRSNCEANCYYNGKKNNIVPSMAIMNLKSNHGWTDRVDTTTKGEKVTLTEEERNAKIKGLLKKAKE